VANLSKTPHINFYQNRSNIAEVMTKKIGVFIYAHSVLPLKQYTATSNYDCLCWAVDQSGQTFDFNVNSDWLAKLIGHGRVSLDGIRRVEDAPVTQHHQTVASVSQLISSLIDQFTEWSISHRSIKHRAATVSGIKFKDFQVSLPNLFQRCFTTWC